MEDVLVKTSDESREIVNELRERLRSMGHRNGDKIVERPGTHWIGWRSQRNGRVFAEVRPLQKRVQVFILPHRRQLRDPKGLAHAAPPTQGWGWFRSRFDVTSMAEVGPAFELLRQSYEWGQRPGNGATRRSRGTRRGQTAL